MKNRLLFLILGVPKKAQTIENNLLLEFHGPSTNLKVKMKNMDKAGAYILVLTY